MSNNNEDLNLHKSEEEGQKDQNRSEEILKSNNELIEAKNKDEKKDVKKQKSESSIRFSQSIKAAIIDQTVILGISMIVLFVLDGILRITSGYFVVKKIEMLFYIYFIVALLYTSIMEAKSGTTVGKGLGKVKVKINVVKIDD